MVAASQPLDATRDALTEARQAPSAESYYQQTASAQAKQTGEMSEREFEAFEVGRRYANTAWNTDLQAMSGDNLTREVARQQSLGNWLALGIKTNYVSRISSLASSWLWQQKSTMRRNCKPFLPR